MIRAVFFDVDFTLIFPGPALLGEGYRRFCAAHGVDVDADRFDAAVAASSVILDDVDEHFYNDDLFIHYTASIIEHMGGGAGPNAIAAASAIYAEWASNHHFELYDDVAPTLRSLKQRGYIVGAISNSHRSLDAFREHFALGEFITTSVSGAEHGWMKPHRSIFEAALDKAGVFAGQSLMVGDSLKADVEGALAAGMHAVLLKRSGEMPAGVPAGVRVIRTLGELDV